MAIGTASANLRFVVRKPALAVFLATAAACHAVEIRVASFNVGAFFTESSGGAFYPLYGLGAAGTPDHESVRAILDRIDADVVALQEIDSADEAGNPNDVQDLATSLGYPHVYIAPDNASGNFKAPFDSDLRVAVISRYPFLSAGAIRSPENMRELVRFHAVVKVDVPGTSNDPVVINAHLKPGDSIDRFRRAVEMKRLVKHLNVLGLTDDDNFIITGDFNLNPNYGSTTYNTLPSGLPNTYALGPDIPFPVSYSVNPLAYFTSPGVARLDPRQLNGSAVTFPGGAGFTLDLMLVSPAIAGRVVDSEIYNSVLDTSNSSGLPKAGSPLAAGTSATASDHYAVFADLELDSEQPDLVLALSAPVLLEGLPDGTVSATVTLPATRPSAVTVSLSSDTPGIDPVAPSLVIPAGALSAGFAIRAPRNFIADPLRAVTFTATASGYDPDSVVLQVDDVDGPYTFTAVGQTVTENFSGFGGQSDPSPWVTSGGALWNGQDAGASVAAGWRSYGSGSEAGLGFLPQGAAGTATASFVNQSAVTLTALQIAFDVEQWRAALGGSAETLSADLIVNGQVIPLPGLAHAASTSLPSGAVAGGLTTAKSTTVSGLAIPPGAPFELRVTFTPGSGGGVAPADVFVNELHYDDAGTDGNEFIEIAVAPGFSGSAADIDVVPYNGSTPLAAVPYSIPPYGSTINVGASFTVGDLVGGYRLYTLTTAPDGIQNGGNDGFALIDKRNGQVLQLVSYEGTFTGAAGTPAAGMTSISITSVSIGVTENNSTPEDSSLGLTGSGGVPGNFTWAVSSGSNTKGAANAGQSFVLPVLPPQGLAIDNLSVTALSDPDSDGDGITNSLDSDDDNDGQSDADELAFGTHPLSAASIFKPVLARAAIPANGFTLSFPGAAGITYAVETSTTLGGWAQVSTHGGTGQWIVVPLALAGPARFYRVRVGQ
jgi:endonuclease/exonuclease/phosphatase family metal-dependent hydrolase